MNADYLIKVLNFVCDRHQCSLSDIRVLHSNTYMRFDVVFEDVRHTYTVSTEKNSVLRYEMKQTISEFINVPR